jgi:hypothetical protein
MFDCGCKVEHMSIDFNIHTGALYVSEGQHPNIQQTSRAFAAIDETIKRIEIYVDGVLDTVLLYLPAHHSWFASPPTEAVFGEIK